MVLVGGSVPPMDIDEFYEADPRRRASAELELGSEWLGKDGIVHELNYVEDTGELYVLREPAPHVNEDPFGGLHVKDPPGYENKITVHVIARDPHGRRPAPHSRRVAAGHARAGQRGHALAGAAAAGGRRGGRPDGRPDFGQLGRRPADQVGGARSSILASSCVAMLSVAMESSMRLPPNTSFESRYMTTAKRKPEKTS